MKKTLLLLLLLFIVPLSMPLFSQDNNISKIEIPVKFATDFDKNKLESLYPESEFKNSPLNGIWVEKKGCTDTLIFKPYYDGQEPIFNLERGQRNNSNLPKYNSGSYHYRLYDGVIKVQWFLSSSTTYNPFYIKLSSDSTEMKIGNFYSTAYQNNDTLIFKRIDSFRSGI